MRTDLNHDAIYMEFMKGEVTITDLAKKHRCSHYSINKILNRKLKELADLRRDREASVVVFNTEFA